MTNEQKRKQFGKRRSRSPRLHLLVGITELIAWLQYATGCFGLDSLTQIPQT